MSRYELQSAFFVKTSLYHGVDCAYEESMVGVLFPPINIVCDSCKTAQTFTVFPQHLDGISTGSIYEVEYICAACGWSRYYYIQFNLDTQKVEKVGQWPAWDISPKENLKEMLGNRVEFYKKGLINESQGYGIGAFCYYRRVVEAIIDDILDELKHIVEDEESYAQALEQAMQQQWAKDKIKIVKDFLPDTLRPNNINPFQVLYRVLSSGLHDKNDDECIELAREIRVTLEFLVFGVHDVQLASVKYEQSIRKLIDSK